MTKLLLGVGVMLFVCANAAAATRYRLSVTRKESNLYRVDGTEMYLVTKYCYEYSYSAEAILVWEGKGSYSNKLIFVDSDGAKKASCDVEALLAETSPS